MSPWDHLHVIGPAFALFVGAGVVLTADLIVDRRAPVRSLTLLALAAAFGYALWHAFTGTEGAAFDGAVVMDRFALYFAFLLIAITAAVAIAASEFAQRIEHGSEFYALLLVSAGSMVLLAQGNDLIAVFVALETTSDLAVRARRHGPRSAVLRGGVEVPAHRRGGGGGAAVRLRVPVRAGGHDPR